MNLLDTIQNEINQLGGIQATLDIIEFERVHYNRPEEKVVLMPAKLYVKPVKVIKPVKQHKLVMSQLPAGYVSPYSSKTGWF